MLKTMLAAAVLLGGLTAQANASTYSTPLPCLKNSKGCAELVEAAIALAGDKARVAYLPSLGILTVSGDDAVVDGISALVSEVSAELRRSFVISVTTANKAGLDLVTTNAEPAMMSVSRGGSVPISVTATPRATGADTVLVNLDLEQRFENGVTDHLHGDVLVKQNQEVSFGSATVIVREVTRR